MLQPSAVSRQLTQWVDICGQAGVVLQEVFEQRGEVLTVRAEKGRGREGGRGERVRGRVNKGGEHHMVSTSAASASERCNKSSSSSSSNSSSIIIIIIIRAITVDSRRSPRGQGEGRVQPLLGYHGLRGIGNGGEKDKKKRGKKSRGD